MASPTSVPNQIAGLLQAVRYLKGTHAPSPFIRFALTAHTVPLIVVDTLVIAVELVLG